MRGQTRRLAAWLVCVQQLGLSPAVPDPLPRPTDLFFSMAGLTSSVASGVSELSLSDVDLGSSVHCDRNPRRLSVQGHPAGECLGIGKNWMGPQCWCHVMGTWEASSDT